MRYITETGVVKFYNGDNVVGELRNCFLLGEIKPVIITEKDIANAKFYRFVDELKYRSKYFSHCYENNT